MWQLAVLRCPRSPFACCSSPQVQFSAPPGSPHCCAQDCLSTPSFTHHTAQINHCFDLCFKNMYFFFLRNHLQNKHFLDGKHKSNFRQIPASASRSGAAYFLQLRLHTWIHPHMGLGISALRGPFAWLLMNGLAVRATPQAHPVVFNFLEKRILTSPWTKCCWECLWNAPPTDLNLNINIDIKIKGAKKSNFFLTFLCSLSQRVGKLI